jgi:hypothetical protein
MKAIQMRVGDSKTQTPLNVDGRLLLGAEDDLVQTFDVAIRAAVGRGGWQLG